MRAVEGAPDRDPRPRAGADKRVEGGRSTGGSERAGGGLFGAGSAPRGAGLKGGKALVRDLSPG